MGWIINFQLIKFKHRDYNIIVYQDFLPIIIFTGLALALIGLPLALQHLLSPRHNKEGDKLLSYECGEVPEGSAWVQFNIRFYVIALIFLIFDVEIVFLFPWAVVYKELGFLAFVEAFLFVLILVIGFVYVWAKGDLDWVKMNVRHGRGRYANLKSEGENI
jgi:NADH-quinone oxidoreductase subunit A